MARRSFHLIADDYALSPGVSEAIRSLLASGRLSGTGCMTVFPEWPEEALRLRDTYSIETREIGLHMTLTDFAPLTGRSSLAPEGEMPNAPDLLKGILQGRIAPADIESELDAQVEQFQIAFGQPPDFLDGHQHTHFLPPVRTWLQQRALKREQGRRPWLRGGPQLTLKDGWAIGQKTLKVGLLARGFDRSARKAGLDVVAPLFGIYHWQDPAAFAPAMERWVKRIPDRAVMMCHPGHIDGTLQARDVFVDARATEYSYLASPEFQALLDKHGLEIANKSG